MFYKKSDYDEMASIASNDVSVLHHKGLSYGDSWRARGGMGAFMMLARKWDRIENQAKLDRYDIFNACYKTAEEPDGLLDDIADLRRYLLLVEEHVRAHYSGPSAEGEPDGRYVNQD